MEDRVYDFWVSCLQDGYIGKLAEIVKRAGGARELFYMEERVMPLRLGITPKLASYIASDRDAAFVERQYYDMMEKEISYVNYMDNDFPNKLRDIPSPPYGLFVKGSLPDENRKSVAIIGARECSEYGRLMAEYFGSRLATRGVDIISGMAWGIDGIAQMAAIRAKGNSYGVLGCGVDVVYPAKNIGLYEMLSANENGLISEYAPGMRAQSRRFPPRNRIIAGLCDVLLVIEAKAKSGTLITVNMAVDQGKTIMIVPGRIIDELSVGCLNLMAEGALPALSVNSVLEELGICTTCVNACDNGNEYEQLSLFEGRMHNMSYCNPVALRTDTGEELTVAQRKLYEAVGIDPVSIDALQAMTGCEMSELLILLTELEIKGLVKELSKGSFVRIF